MSDPCLLSYKLVNSDIDPTEIIFEKRKLSHEAMSKIQESLLFTN